MEVRKVEIPVGFGRTDIIIRQFTDIHEGATGHDAKLFRRGLALQEQDRHSWCIFTGDLIDADRPTMRDRKAHIYADEDRKEAWTQEDRRNFSWLDASIVPKYKRIAPRCLGILDGDHYLIFSNGMTSGQYICKRTGIPYLGERMAFVAISFVDPHRKISRYTILARHGKGSGVTSGGSVNAMERQNHGFRANLYLGGHNHREHIHPLKIAEVNRIGTKINQHVVWYVRGGSFLDGYPCDGTKTYAEHEEYRPLCQGWAEIELTAHHIRNPAGGSPKGRMLVVEARKASMVAE